MLKGSSEQAQGQLLEELRKKDEAIVGLTKQIKDMNEVMDSLKKQLT